MTEIISIPEESAPTFTHRLSKLKHDNGDELIVIKEEVQEHVDSYISFFGEQVDLSTKVIGFLNPRAESKVGMVVNVNLSADKTYQYMVEVPLEAVQHLQTNPSISIISNEKKFLVMIPLDEETKQQLWDTGVKVQNMNSYKYGGKLALKTSEMPQNLIKDLDKIAELQKNPENNKSQISKELGKMYCYYGFPFRISKRGKKRGEKLREKYYKGERLVDDELKDAYGLLISMSVDKLERHAGDLLDELMNEMEKRFGNSNPILVDFLKSRGYIEKNPDFMPEMQMYFEAYLVWAQNKLKEIKK